MWRPRARSAVTQTAGVLGVLVASFVVTVAAQTSGDLADESWSYFGGDNAFTRYSPLDQIDRDNIGRVRIVWRRPAVGAVFTEAFPDLSPSNYLNATPIMVGGVLYAPNGLGLVEAFHPATGATIWTQRPAAPTLAAVAGQSTRGVAYWRDGDDQRIFSVRNTFLHALDAGTGVPIEAFGANGRVDLTPPGARRANGGSSPIVVGDVVVVGGTVDGAGDGGVRWRGSAPEDVRGYDARDGRLLWTFHVVPREGEFGVDTWGNDSWRESGDLGAWCCLSADNELGYVYVPLTAPTAAYYGGHRPGDNLFSNSLVALDAMTGERVWHFQMVHHDLWEYDTIGPPTLGTLTVDGRSIDAVMQPSKTGFLYVFDRATGEPVWPIEERPVPQSTVPGEHSSPTQPFPTKPPPFAHQGVVVDDLIDLTTDLRERAEETVRSFVVGPLFTPPSLVSTEPGGTQGTLALPGSWGSGNWNTGAFDPETGLYYAFSHTVPRVYRIADASGQPGAEMDFYSPNREAPYLDGLPLTKPPWGRITAIDLNAGEHRWVAANGDGLRDHPMLAGLDLPSLGIASRPVALVTKTLLLIGEGGNVFGGIQPNMHGRIIRAYDKSNGSVVWSMELPAGTTGGPMTYMFEGRQYIVVPVGAREHAAEWVALALP